MIRKSIENAELGQHLAGLAPDSRELFLLADGHIRGILLHGSRMVNEMRENHEYGILESFVLGHAYLGAGLLTSTLKGDGKVQFSIECGGPIQGLTAEADASGNVRGYLRNVPIPVSEPLDDLDLSPFFGPGFLSVTKYQQNETTPYSGQVMLQYGNIAQDLATYYMMSEQIPTSFTLSIKFDRSGQISGAGGLFLQVMPGADESLLEKVEEKVYEMPSLGQYFADGGLPLKLLQESFADFSPLHLSSERIEFLCSCSKERFSAFLASLPADEKTGILDEGPFPLRTTCHNCNSTYEFTRGEIQELFSN